MTSRQAATRTEAGLILITMALSALLLGYPEPPLYRPGLPPHEEDRLYELAKQYVVMDPRTVQDLDLFLTSASYGAFAGREPFTTEIYTVALPACLRLGLLDEGSPAWDGLGRTERETYRRVAREVINTIRLVIVFVLFRGSAEAHE